MVTTQTDNVQTAREDVTVEGAASKRVPSDTAIAKQGATKPAAGKYAEQTHTARNLTLFVGCVLFWFILDRITKVCIESAYAVGTHGIAYLDTIIRIDLVHNTGAAWGAFSGSTTTIALVGIALCAVVLAFALYERRVAPKLEMFGLALVLAGGLGNLYDRFVLGYVIDMITPVFISFPTFNVADIGVTCGIALVIISLIVQVIQEHTANNTATETAASLSTAVPDGKQDNTCHVGASANAHLEEPAHNPDNALVLDAEDGAWRSKE